MSCNSLVPQGIELFRTERYYIFIRDDNSLWWDRRTGQFDAKTASDLVHAEDPSCLGILYGIIGKIPLFSSEDRLLLIRECALVGELPGGHPVYKVKNISFLSLTEDPHDLGLEQCRKHREQRDGRRGPFGAAGLFDQKAVLGKTWGSIKSAGNTIKTTTQQAAALAALQVKQTGNKRESKDREKFERRILEELGRLFTETHSFYFSLTGDVTNSLQRQGKREQNKFVLKDVDDRFFWNKNMLQDIIDLQTNLAEAWVIPIIQGFIQIEPCKVEVGYETQNPRYETFTLMLISRRSRFRAGTRYKRRGVDEDGKCANYVETEQIISYNSHTVSLVQVRGSVPVFWSQPGYKYRPPPRLDKGPAETQIAFEKHFKEELEIYGPVCVVNLIEQSGKERIVWDAYTNHILNFNSPSLTYATFDFHEYCRGMHFENVSLLVESLVDVMREMMYCWKDKEGIICNQKGVFRVNCIDCLDRTNVVQTALAKAAMEVQLYKLGLIPPEGIIPNNLRSTFQQLWANNGDIISKQYAGTNALKGDYTRTGERKLTGMMKDGMNSANRYYLGHFADSYRQASIDIMQGQSVPLDTVDSLNQVAEDLHDVVNCVVSDVQNFSPLNSTALMPTMTYDLSFAPELKLAASVFLVGRYYLNRFKDVYRQATIDFMLGNPISEEEFSNEKTSDEDENANTAEHVKQLIEDCKKMLISDSSMVLGAWGLIDADPTSGDPTETEIDTILILTKDSYYVADYDEQIDRITKYQQVDLPDISWIEMGIADFCTSGSLFKHSSKIQHHCFRIHYCVDGQPGYFHMFRSSHLRFFNNVAVEIRSSEEMAESLKAMCETFSVALEISGITSVPTTVGRNLEKMKSRVISTDPSRKSGGLLSSYLDVASIPTMTRNVSETQLSTLKSVGSKALSNMTNQFTRLNRLGHNLNSRTQYARQDLAEEQIRAKSSPPINESSNILDLENPVSGKATDAVSPAQELLTLRDTLNDCHLDSVGIVMAHKKPTQKNKTSEMSGRVPLIHDVSLSRVVHQETSASQHLRKYPLMHSRTDLVLDVSNLPLTSVKPVNKTVKVEPEKNASKLTPPNTLFLNKKLSHSSGEVNTPPQPQPSIGTSSNNLSCHPDGSNLAEGSKGVSSAIITSKSENSLKTIGDSISHAISSPVASSAKDIVLSPFSKLAKGMQNLGANLDPRKLKGGVVSPAFAGSAPLKVHSEEQKILMDRWKNCETKLIAL